MSINSDTIRIYAAYAKPYQTRLIGSVLIIPTALFAHSFIIPLIAAGVLDDLATNPQAKFSGFITPLVLTLAAGFYGTIMWRVADLLFWKSQIYTARDLAAKIFNHLIFQSEKFHADHFGGALVASATRFINSYERITDELIWSVYPLILSFIFTVIILFPRSPLYVGVLTLFTLCYLMIILVLRKREVRASAKYAAAETLQTAQLADSITNITTVRSFGQEGVERALFAKRSQNVARRGVRVMWVGLGNAFVQSNMFIATSAAALAMAILAVTHFNAPIGTVLLILSYTGSILERLWNLTATMRNINRALGDTQEMTELLGQPADVIDTVNAEPLIVSRGDIVFDEVDFAYPDSGGNLFKGFSLVIPAGERVGLVGPSGGGKTTITKLLLRFADLSSGSILIDGQNIAEVSQINLRQQIAYIPQEPLLFHRSLADNISYGRPNATDAEIQAAAEKARATEFIDKLPKGYDTLVGERGTKLSGGQRQRIAIARAILKDAPILVLDEATSALDSRSEKLIQEALHDLMSGRTTIVIAHRLSTIAELDRILVMHEGEIVEEGNHQELIAEDGLYANLWQHQSGGFLEPDDTESEDAELKPRVTHEK